MKKHFIFFASITLLCSFAGCSCDDDDDDMMMTDAGTDTAPDVPTGGCTPNNDGPGAITAPSGISAADACTMTIDAFIALDRRCCTDPLSQIDETEFRLGAGRRCADVVEVTDLDGLFANCVSDLNSLSCDQMEAPASCMMEYFLFAP